MEEVERDAAEYPVRMGSRAEIEAKTVISILGLAGYLVLKSFVMGHGASPADIVDAGLQSGGEFTLALVIYLIWLHC